MAFCPNVEVVIKMTLKGAVDDVFDSASNLVASPAPIKPVIYWSQYSSFVELLRSVAFILRFNLKFRPYLEATLRNVDSSEFENAKTKLLFLSQMEAFASET